MYADVSLQEDTTTLYVRWEISFEGSERRRLESLGGPLTLLVEASQYVDVGGAFHEKADVEVPIFPHAGRRNLGQAKFKDYEARRRFIENLQRAVAAEVAIYVADASAGSVGVDGHAIRRPEFASTVTAPQATAGGSAA